MSKEISETDLLQRLSDDAAKIRFSHSSIKYSDLIIHRAVEGLDHTTTMTKDGRKLKSQTSPDEHILYEKYEDFNELIETIGEYPDQTYLYGQ